MSPGPLAKSTVQEVLIIAEDYQTETLSVGTARTEKDWRYQLDRKYGALD